MIGKDLEQILNHSWEEPTSNWLQIKGRLIEMILGIQDTKSEQIQRSQWLDPRNQKSSILSHPGSFPSLFFDGLNLKIFLLKASTHSEEVQAICPRALYDKASPSKERSLEPLEFKGVFWMTHLSSHVQPLISHPGRAMWSYDWLYLIIGPDSAAHMIVSFLQNYMTEGGERQPQG